MKIAETKKQMSNYCVRERERENMPFAHQRQIRMLTMNARSCIFSVVYSKHIKMKMVDVCTRTCCVQPVLAVQCSPIR